MTTPLIDIRRHDFGMYEWSLLYERELLDGEIGDPNIEACLAGALSSISEIAQLVQISYRGVNVGTYSVDVISEDAARVSARIVESFAAQHLK